MAAKGDQILPLSTATDTFKKCVSNQEIGVGDCKQLAGCSISLQRSEDEEGQATFTWKATTWTSHHTTLGHDTWQQRFEFTTGDGGIVAVVPHEGMLRGPNMDANYRNYDVKRTGIVDINPALWDQIAAVHWFYEC